MRTCSKTGGDYAEGVGPAADVGNHAAEGLAAVAGQQVLYGVHYPWQRRRAVHYLPIQHEQSGVK